MSKPYLVVVDDEPGIGELVCKVANSVGFESESVTHAKTLQKIFATVQPAVIVLDIVMPDIDGIELIRWLIDNDCTAAIILTSGYDKVFLETAQELGEQQGMTIVGSIVKPFSILDLSILLEKALAAKTVS